MDKCAHDRRQLFQTNPQIYLWSLVRIWSVKAEIQDLKYWGGRVASRPVLDRKQAGAELSQAQSS